MPASASIQSSSAMACLCNGRWLGKFGSPNLPHEPQRSAKNFQIMIPPTHCIFRRIDGQCHTLRRQIGHSFPRGASSHAASAASHRLIVEPKEENSFRECVVPVMEKCCISRVRRKVSQASFPLQGLPAYQMPIYRMIHDVMAPKTSSLVPS